MSQSLRIGEYFGNGNKPSSRRFRVRDYCPNGLPVE